MERVSYHLERLLPSLQLLQQHDIFTSQELNHLTNQRRSKETNLIRRKVEAVDYLEYAQWESQLEDLRVEKCIRLDIPSKIQSKLRTYHLSHVISIYERGLRRLKYHVGLWKHYINWAKKMKMNTVVGRVVARALSLHPTNLELWLTSSSYELNQSGSADSARTLLQRGIRLNKVGFSSSSSSLSNKRTLEESPKSKKRRKISQTDSIISPEVEERVKDGVLKFNLPKEEELKILHLVLSHIRMELVFIERIRRRRLVLGIDESDSTSEAEAQIEEDDDDREEEEIENEKEAMERSEVPITDEIEGQENIQSKEKPEDKQKGPSYTSNSKGLTSLLQGSIPLALLKDSLGLSIISDEDDDTRVQSTNGLPPNIHYFLFIAFLNIVRTFPFLNKDGSIAGVGKEDSLSQGGDRLRKHLLDQGFILFKERYPSSTEENYEIIKLLEISRESDDLLINPLTRLNELRVLNSKQNDEDEEVLDEIEPEEESTRNTILRLNSILQSNGEIELIHLVSAFKRNQRSKLDLVGFQLKNFTENLKDQYQIVGDDFPRFIQKIFKEENWEDDEDEDVANKMIKPELKIKVLETFIRFSQNGDEAIDEEYNPFAEQNLKKYLLALKRKWIKDYLSDEEVRTSFLVNRIHLDLRLEGMISKDVEDQESWIDLKNNIEAQLVRLKIRDDKEQELKFWLILIRFWETLPASLVDLIAEQGKANPKKMNGKHQTQDLSKQIEIQRREKLNSVWNSLIDRTEVSLSVGLDQDETQDGLQLFKKWTQFLSTSNFKSGLVNFRNAIDKTLGFLNRTSSSLNKGSNSIASNIDVEKLVKIHDLVLIAFYEFGLEKSKLISNENEVDVDDNNESSHSKWDQDRIEKVLGIIKNFSKPSGLIWSEILRSERNRLGLKDWEWLNNDQENISLDDDDDEEDEDDGEKEDQLKTKFKPFSSLDQRLQTYLENLNSFFLTLTSKQTENDGTRIYSHLNQLQFLYDDLDQKANAMRYVEIVRKELNQSGGGGDEDSLRRLEEGWRKICEM